MRTFALLIVGVVVGWAASGVDWSRDVLAQEASKSTDGVLTFELSDTPVDVPASNSVPRSAGNPDDLDPLRRPTMKFSEPLFDSAPVVNDDQGKIGRFQASAYGSPNGHGCYIVDTTTGETWHVASGEGRPATPEALNQPAAQPTATATTPLRGMSTFSSSPLMYGESSLGLEEGEGQSSEADAIPAPTLELARPTPDANN